MSSPIQIISDAFISLGKEPINSPLTDDPIFKAALVIYNHKLPEVLTVHPWRFAMKNLDLTKVDEVSPFNRWQNIFEMPGDMLLAYRTEPAAANFEIFENRLYTNLSEIKLEYTFQASEANFPPYFTDLMVMTIASRMAMAVTQLVDMAKLWTGEAQRQLIVARGLDSSIMPNPSVVRDPIWEAHVGSTASFRGVI